MVNARAVSIGFKSLVVGRPWRSGLIIVEGVQRGMRDVLDSRCSWIQDPIALVQHNTAQHNRAPNISRKCHFSALTKIRRLPNHGLTAISYMIRDVSATRRDEARRTFRVGWARAISCPPWPGSRIFRWAALPLCPPCEVISLSYQDSLHQTLSEQEMEPGWRR